VKNAFIIVLLQLLSVIVFSCVSAFQSFTIYLLLIGFLCGVSATFYSRINIVNLRHVILILAPMYSSYLFYWFPQLNHQGNAEFEAWEFIFVIPGTLLGLFVSIIVYLINIKAQRKK
jgi:hypothetical protein